MKIQRSCCNALIGTEQEQINQLYEIVKALAGNYFEGFEIMGTYNTATNYDKKYMLVFYNGGTYVKTVDGDSINFAPDLHPDKWALFTYPAQGERGPKGEGATVAELAEKIQGSETVVIDENEAGTALEVHLDAETVNKIDRAILTPNSAPVADRIPYIDFISGAVKYANLSGNVQIDGTGALESRSGGNPLYLHKCDINIGLPSGYSLQAEIFYISNTEIVSVDVQSLYKAITGQTGFAQIGDIEMRIPCVVRIPEAFREYVGVLYISKTGNSYYPPIVNWLGGYPDTGASGLDNIAYQNIDFSEMGSIVISEIIYGL